jgi:hypothetical protein
MGRRSFTPAEIDELRRLIREKQTADPSRQKALRARMRRMGFHISDFASDVGGFVASDLDDLIRRGVIVVGGADAVPETPPPLTPSPAPQAAEARDAAEVVAALAGTPVRVAAALEPTQDGGAPSAPGFYAWWSAQGVIAGAPHHPHPERPELGLLYVGISPARPSSRGGIRSRALGQHVRGNTSSSTFRFVLASLLREELALTPRRSASKIVLDNGDNYRLRQWQLKHLSLTWCVRERPWEVEGEVIALMEPPLNSSGNRGHPFYSRVSSARAVFRAAASPPQPRSLWFTFAHTKKPIPVRVTRCSPVGTEMRVKYEELLPSGGRPHGLSLGLDAWDTRVAKGEIRPYSS